jgi:hypothetical protein
VIDDFIRNLIGRDRKRAINWLSARILVVFVVYLPSSTL